MAAAEDIIAPLLHTLAQAAPSVPTLARWGEFDNAWIIGLVYMALVGLGLVVGVFLLVTAVTGPSHWERHVRHLRERPWNLPEVGRILLLLLILQGIGAGLLATGRGIMGLEVEDNPGLAVVAQSLLFHWAGLVLIGCSLLRRKEKWKSAFGLGLRPLWKDVGMGVAYYLAMLPFLWFYSVLYQVVLKFTGYESYFQEVAWVLTDDHPWFLRAYMLCVAALLAPVVEELLFRGLGLTSFARVVNTSWAILITAGLFALIHFHVPSIIPLYVISVGFSLAYIHSESIVVSMVMHALFNTVNLCLLFVLRG